MNDILSPESLHSLALLWQGLLWPLLRLLLGLCAGLLLANLLEALRWTRHLSRLATPLARAAHLRDVAGALQASPGMKQQTFVAGFSAGAGSSAGGIGYNESVAPTLKGSPGGNCMPSVLCLNDQGGSVMNCSENISGTLRAQEHGHQPLVYENHGIDSRYTGPHKVAPTMSARYGTGGNNVPLVEQEADAICIAGNTVDRQPQNGGNGLGCQDDLAYTLTATDRLSGYPDK